MLCRAHQTLIQRATDLRELVRHSLLLPYGLSKLDPLVRVLDRLVERALSETDHLRGDPDAALVEDLDRDLRALERKRSVSSLREDT